MRYEELVQSITDIFYTQLDVRATFGDAQDILDDWNPDFTLIDTEKFGEKIIYELGEHVDRKYLKNKFESESN